MNALTRCHSFFMTAIHASSNNINIDIDINKWLMLVRRIAFQLSMRLPSNIELDDLVQSGCIGLLEAHDRYDKSQRASFETFISHRVYGAMIDELRKIDCLPRNQRKKVKQIEALTQRLQHELLRPPTLVDIALRLNVDVNQVNRLLRDAEESITLSFEDYSENVTENSHSQHWLSALLNESADPSLICEWRELLIFSTEAIETLTPKQRRILEYHYQEGMTHAEIAKKESLTAARVSQIIKAATGKIGRNAM